MVPRLQAFQRSSRVSIVEPVVRYRAGLFHPHFKEGKTGPQIYGHLAEFTDSAQGRPGWCYLASYLGDACKSQVGSKLASFFPLCLFNISYVPDSVLRALCALFHLIPLLNLSDIVIPIL